MQATSKLKLTHVVVAIFKLFHLVNQRSAIDRIKPYRMRVKVLIPR